MYIKSHFKYERPPARIRTAKLINLESVLICSVKFIMDYFFIWFRRFEGVMEVHYDLTFSISQTNRGSLLTLSWREKVE